MRKKLLVLLITAVLVLAGIELRVLLWPPLPRPPVDTSGVACGRLRLGMTEGEVEAVIGGPAGNYATERYLGSCFPISGQFPGLPTADECEKKWVTDVGEIIVRFNKGGEAVLIRGGVGFVRESWDDKIYRYHQYVFPISDPERERRIPRSVPSP